MLTGKLPYAANTPMGMAVKHITEPIPRILEARSDLSQRDLARELGASLGKVNYCLNALIDKGLVKVRNFRNSRNKLGYAYLLTPRGIDSKATIAVHFLQRKMAEYETLKVEIEQLQREVAEIGARNPK